MGGEGGIDCDKKWVASKKKKGTRSKKPLGDELRDALVEDINPVQLVGRGFWSIFVLAGLGHLEREVALEVEKHGTRDWWFGRSYKLSGF